MPDRSTNENNAVEAYLQFLATGVLPVDEDHEATLEVLDERIANEPLLHRKVTLIAQRHRLTNPTPADASPLVAKFVQYAATFSERNKITYTVWREMGVPPRVLKEAGIPMTLGPRTPSTNGAAPKGVKLALHDPKRIRPYAPRRTWTDAEKEEYVAISDANGGVSGVEAAMKHFDLDCTLHAAKQRYHHYRREIGLPPRTRVGRPRNDASQPA